MINRVLIRIKVVQILYSYLVSDSAFSIEQPAESQTREKRFAYQAYLDMLALMVEAAGKIKQRGGYAPLAHTRFIETIATEERISAIVRRRVQTGFTLESLAEGVASKIKESALYRNFIKDGSEDHRIWSDLYKYFVAEDSGLIAEFSKRENYTLHGLERARKMIESTFSAFYASSDDVSGAVKSLERSLRTSRELYLRLLTLPVAITKMREQEIEDNRNKYIRTAEDENPNLRFVDNKLISLLERDDQLQAERDSDNSLNWIDDDRLIIRSLLKAIMQSDIYKEYMEKPGPVTLEEDADFWRDIFKKIIFRNEDFLSSLEDKSVFWNDDLDILGEFVLKTFKRFAVEGEKANGFVKSQMMPMYKDEVDRAFGRELLTAALRNRTTYRTWIADAVDNTNWDSSRLALMDVVILITALAEIMNFPNIPLQVSVNEYINIAKCYSTPKSGQFVNGILGAIITRLKESGELMK